MATTELPLSLEQIILILISIALNALVVWFYKLMKRVKQRIEDVETSAKNVEDKIATYRKEVDKYGEEISTLREASMKEVENAEQRIKIIADKIGLKGDLLSWGRLMFIDGKYDEAIATLSELLVSEPRNGTALFYRGLCFFRKKGRKYSIKAVEDLEKAVEADKKVPDRHLALSNAYFKARMLEEAEREAKKALELGIHDKLEAKVTIAKTRFFMGDNDRAIEAFKECPLTHSPAVTGLGRALLNKARQASSEERRQIYTSIIKHYTDAVGINPRVADYYTFRAQVYAERNEPDDWSKALEDWEKAKTISPRDVKPWTIKGDAIYQRCNGLPKGSERETCLKKALKNYGEALIRSPESYKPTIRNKRSLIYQSLGHFDVALQEAKAGAQENPDYVTNFMAWATAAISAFAWKEVIEASTSGLKIAEETRSRGGVIWCLLFRVIGRCGDLQTPESNAEDCKTLTDEIRNFPTFDPIGWDWSVAKGRLKQAMAEWPTDTSPLVQHLIELIGEGLNK